MTRGALLLAAVVLGATLTVQADAPVASPVGQDPGSDVATFGTPERVAVPEPTPQALAYRRSGNLLWVLDTVWALLVPAVLLWTGASARMRDWARAIGRKWFFVVALYFVFFALVTTVIDLPLVYYESYVRQHAYGLSNQTISKWATDQAANLGVVLVIGSLSLWVPYLLLARSPRRWWLYTGLLAVPFIVLINLVTPIWIDPLFNRFGPMKDQALEAEILHLADRAGITGGRVFEVAKSEDTKALNAYVNGFAGTKRIVLWDTIIAALDRPQLLVVMGHEMGHYVLGHVRNLIGILSLTILVMLYLVHRVAGVLITRFRRRFGFSGLADVASLPLILLLFNLASLVQTPIVLGVQRHFEHEADRFALEITRDSHAAATAFVILQQENLGVPRPGRLYTWFRESHPPLGERIDFSNDYRPWESNQPLVYGGRFKAR